MPLDIIGPGFGRTGTASLKRALEILGYGPCHHMEEVFANPHQVSHWEAVGHGHPVVWDTVFEGYRAQVDWPGAHPWRDLVAAYPNAKVVLSVRPEESWWKSFSSTIGTLLQDVENPNRPPHVRTMLGVGQRMIVEQTFGAPVTDKQAACAALRRRTEEVRAEVPADRLLMFDVSEGWEPLCRFLEVDIPGEPFPHVNSTAEFWELVNGGPKH